MEKQSKTSSTPTDRKSNRGRSSTSPKKQISLRQQPIDASENIQEKDNTNIYEEIDAVVEKKEPAGRKRKSTISTSPVTNKRRCEVIFFDHIYIHPSLVVPLLHKPFQNSTPVVNKLRLLNNPQQLKNQIDVQLVDKHKPQLFQLKSKVQQQIDLFGLLSVVIW